MKKYILISMILSICIMPSILAAKDENLIQVAILLDTSNSMDGLIDQAKSQLWKIVNELSAGKKDGKAPRLQVALYEYGNDGIPAGEGHIRMASPLTNDLDKISNELFKLTTNGGSEYCGMVIDSAVKGLKWSKDGNVFKVIFIAGNEPFTQGGSDYTESVKRAVSKGITVNTIFCGNYDEGVNTKWKHGADLSDGTYINIDHNQKIAHINAPQDKEIMKLGEELNKTYVAYGAKGMIKKEMQAEQDKNARTVSEESLVQRSVSKASGQYVNNTWDLVDAVKDSKVKVSDVDEKLLPGEMKKMDRNERDNYIKSKIKERERLQKKINALNAERKIYVDRELKKNGEQNTFDAAILRAVKKQATEKNFKFQ
ncbi:MAG: VWA domain-containing protein [Spirochaetes bacterium]|nr:VWA domain-containing protein [Spirochaetota bacterium]